MNNIQKYRRMIQIIAVVLTAIGFLTNFKLAMPIILVTTVVGGVFYCGYICPFGFLQDLLSYLGRKLGIKKRKMPKTIGKYLVYSRYIILALVTLVTTSIIFDLLALDPRENFANLLMGHIAGLGAILIIIIFAVVSMFFDRPFCNYMCFQGAKYGLFSGFRFFAIKRDSDQCVSCKKCDKACPMNIEVSTCDQVNSIQCINCMQCITECPVDGTLTYGKVKWTNIVKKRIIMAVIAGIFIGLGYLVVNSGIVNQDRSSIDENNTVQESENEINDNTDSSTIDGVYYGVGQGFRGEMRVAVTIEEEKIVDVTVTDYVDDAKWFNRAVSAVPNSIIDAQSVEVDVVSGATYSSRGIIEGAQKALENIQ